MASHFIMRPGAACVRRNTTPARLGIRATLGTETRGTRASWLGLWLGLWVASLVGEAEGCEVGGGKSTKGRAAGWCVDAAGNPSALGAQLQMRQADGLARATVCLP